MNPAPPVTMIFMLQSIWVALLEAQAAPLPQPAFGRTFGV
jgi:hypothetical protein